VYAILDLAFTQSRIVLIERLLCVFAPTSAGCPLIRIPMRPFKRSVSLLFMVGFTSIACSPQDPSNQTTSSSGSSSPRRCEDVFFKEYEPCAECTVKECCAELSACANADTMCTACASMGPKGDQRCAASYDLSTALRECLAAHCKPSCGIADPSEQEPGGFIRADCEDTEIDGTVTSADCIEPNTTVLRGKLYGIPFDQTFSNTSIRFSQSLIEGSLLTTLPDVGNGPGYVDLYWHDILTLNHPVCVDGALRLPSDTYTRGVGNFACKLRLNEPEGIYQFRLFMHGSELAGCTR